METTKTHKTTLQESNLLKQLGWLKKLSDGLKTLKPNQFITNSVDIKEYDFKNNTGLICSAFGWMPKFVPESRARYRVHFNTRDVIVNHSEFHIFYNISNDLLKFIFFEQSIFDDKAYVMANLSDTNPYKLFIKHMLTDDSKESEASILEKYGDNKITLQQTINRMDAVYDFYKSLKIGIVP